MTQTQTQALTTTGGSGSGTLAARYGLSEDKLALVRRTVAAGATDDELELFLTDARRRGLDPFARQIYFIKYSQSKPGAIITGIDGYRLIAERTGVYAGSDDAVFEGESDEGFPERATVTVYKIVAGVRCAFTASARWKEYYNHASGMWDKMPHTMLAKCFDEQTEVLTDQGFQKFSAVTGRVLQVTDSGLEPTKAKPFFQGWDGEMVTLDSDDLNFSVTPNHDMLTTDGKIEAGAMYDEARARPRHFIPRVLNSSRNEWGVSDFEIQLTAAYLADGQDIMGGFLIGVSRPAKVARLDELGGYANRRIRRSAGEQAHTAVRTITTRADKTLFAYRWADVSWLCISGKGIKSEVLPLLSRRQARLLVETWLAFDGHTNKKTGVRRFYSSRTDHMAAFELACVVAGYSVSQRRGRTSDISSRPNYYVTVSSRSDIPIRRWGRDYNSLSTGNASRRTGLTLTRNESGFVWCVTVPSGVIVVRRNGFSMLCGNCAEALALRKAFPAELSGLYVREEMDQAREREEEHPVATARPAGGRPRAERHPAPRRTTTPALPPARAVAAPPPRPDAISIGDAYRGQALYTVAGVTCYQPAGKDYLMATVRCPAHDAPYFCALSGDPVFAHGKGEARCVLTLDADGDVIDGDILDGDTETDGER